MGGISARSGARKLIETIAQEHTLNGTIFGTKFEVLVNNCLEILSNQLYEKSTHFLLELIQNADDNIYRCATPSLTFSYKSGSLRIDCNEVGFTASNVAAICGISQSTKSGKTSDGEFIGEKGIGFKSVFKAADVVWIASNEFTFKFDRTQPLGVILPIWEEFPETTRPDFTSIYLQLSKTYDENILVKELLEFDTNLLIFLRRIEELNIQVCRADEHISNKRISKKQYQEGLDRIVVLQAGTETLKYLVRTHVIRDLPQEIKRPNWPQTKIILAFPISDSSEQPVLKPQNVYAFLPIRNYGFRFLIQGDFLLTASREDIESTLPWNRRIRDALAEAFILSMFHFNEGLLKYIWPYYLPTTSMAVSTFFEPAIESILNRLRESDVFESCAGTMVKPSSLVHVPADLCAEETNIPFTLCSLTQDRYLSPKYPSWVIEAMTSVGVCMLSPRQFLEDLSSFIAHDAEEFRNKPFQWHSQLAKALVKLSIDTELKPLIQELCIIPLHDGTWTAVRDHSIFFAKGDTSLQMPSGIRALIVDSVAELDPNRRTLFTSLGVKAWEAPEICRLILKLHESTNFEPTALTATQLVSHAVFLYQAAWQPPKGADLWFATVRDERCRGRKMYIPGSVGTDTASARLFSHLEKHFAVMHGDYLATLASEAEWPDWLVHNLGLSRIPRLVTPVVEPKPQPVEVAKDWVQDVSMAPQTPLPQKDEHPLNDVSGQLKEDTTQSTKPLENPEDDIWGWGFTTKKKKKGKKSKLVHVEIESSNEVNKDIDLFKQETEPQMNYGFGILDTKPSMPEKPAEVRVDAEHNITAQDIAGSDDFWATFAKKNEQPKVPKIDESGLDDNEITLVMQQANVSRNQAIRALKEQDNDIVNAILSLAGVENEDKIPSPKPWGVDGDDIWGTWGTPASKKKKKGKKGKILDTPPEPGKVSDSPKVTLSEKGGENLAMNASPVLFDRKEPVFTLSEEFTFMFRECDSSDILQLLRENWHHYSQWIDGAHMKWQSDDFVFASTQLKNKMGASLVRTTRGLSSLDGTVLGSLDTQLDTAQTIHTLEIKDPQHAEWNLLSYFGVLLKADIHYYLRCLITVSTDPHPDIDTAAYIYEQIQTRYTGNEDLIRAAFYERDIILVPSEIQSCNEQPAWTRMGECLSKEIDIESKYPSCSYLFRCLASPSGDPIGGLVHTMTLINASSKLDDISRLFREVSKSLNDVSTSKAALLLKPLQNKAIFPIIDGSGKLGYDALLDLHDKTWFIADQANFIDSFTGIVPFLAFAVQDLPALNDLFRALRVDDRKMSKRMTSETVAKGQIRMSWQYTNSLRSKSPFIKALIPRAHPEEATLKRQITELRVSIATTVSQTFTINLPDKKLHGNPIPGQVTISSTDNTLTLSMTEDCATAECPPHELVSLLAETCFIKDQKHFSLLHTALSDLSIKSINSAFLQQGIQVEGLSLDAPKSTDRYHAQRSDGMHMPSPFLEKLIGMDRSSHGLPEAIVYGQSKRKGGSYKPKKRGSKQSQATDRRLPMVDRIRGAGSVYSNIPLGELVPLNREFVGWEHIQYLGENIISKLLHTYLGHSYDAERDWTSSLRRRSGLASFTGSTSNAPFTLRDPITIRRMTDFIIENGFSKSLYWKEQLRRSLPVCHVDVAISAGGKGSTFVTTTEQLERMRKFKLRHDENMLVTDVSILLRVGDAYSEDDFSLNIFVDPWYLVNDSHLNFDKNWLLAASLDEDDPAHIGNGQQLATTFLPWTLSASTGVLRNKSSILYSTGSRELYSYNVLPPGYMRLLYLLPGTADEPLYAVVNQVRNSSTGAYLALSYVWGTNRRLEELITPDGVILITSSLSKALRGLRQENKAIMVWADAVCINQADNKEKAQQIQMLPHIFQSSTSTYAFLDGGEDADSALEMLMQVRSKAAFMEAQRTKEDIDAYDWPSSVPRIPASWKGGNIPPLHHDIWASVEALFKLPYFRRVWVIQEIVAAPSVKIVCGKWLIDWNDLHLALQTVDHEVQISDQNISQLRSSWEPFLSLAAQREWEARQYRWSLVLLLENFRYAQSTLTRDRLFALVGLASDGNEAEFEADYDSPLEQVILKFGRVFVQQGRGIQLLYRAGLNAQSDRFPSWIPDWTIERPIGLHDSSDTGVTFSACGPQVASIECGPGADELSIDGYEMDIIERVSTASNVEQEWEDYFKELDEIIDTAVLSSVVESREDLKWKVPVASAKFPRAAGSGAMNMKKSYGIFRNYINSTRNLDALDDSNNGHTSYTTCLKETLAGGKFVVTRRGYVGIVPDLARVGDIVAIMKGGCVPFLLQESMVRPGAFRLVGECYIHGIMGGEGIWLPGVAEKTFCLH